MHCLYYFYNCFYIQNVVFLPLHLSGKAQNSKRQELPEAARLKLFVKLGKNF